MTEQQQQQHETAEYKSGTGGIAWAGSLMGSQNPNNLGYRYSTPSKRYRFASDGVTNGNNDKDALLPSNIQVQFQNRQGEALANASTLDIPTNSTVDDLTALVNSLLNGDNTDDNNNNKVPYSFYTKIIKNGVSDDVEITTSLLTLLQNYNDIIKTEAVLQLVYQPLAVFRVRPVTRCTDTLPGHTEAVLHVQFAPHGRILASGGGDAMVRFWDVYTGTPKFKPTTGGHKNHVLATAWSPDGQRFVSADKNGVLIVWNPFTGMSMGKHIKAHKQWITAISFEPMHAVTLSTSTTSSSVPVSDKQSISSSNGDNNNNNNIDDDDSSLGCCCHRLVTSSKDGTAKIWNIKTQKLQYTLSGHTDSVEACKWGGEGFIYTASRDRTIKVWNSERGILVRTLTGHGHRINTLALSSDYVLRTGPFDYKCWKFDNIQQAHAAAVQKYQDFKQQQQGTTSGGGASMERLVSGSDDYTLHLWHPTESKHAIKRLTGHQQAVNHIAFSPDGRYFASASFDKKTKVWNGYSGDFITTLTGHVGAVYQVAWSADSRHLVTASKDSTSKLWEPMGIDKSKSGGNRAGSVAKETLPGHADEVYALDWSPNGSCVATGSKDRTIKIWKH